jgi:uncharacterized protein (DUF1015 family)
VLVRDEQPAIYVYEQSFSVGGVTYMRQGFFALARLDRSRILTHEETRKKAKEDRTRLLTATKLFTSMVFGLYEDKEGHIDGLLGGSSSDAVYDFIDEQGVRNRFSRMTDPDKVAAVTDGMEAKNIYIADGHHRLAVSFSLGIPYMPIYLTNMYSNGIVILPYHRALRLSRPRDLGDTLAALKGYVRVERIACEGDGTMAEALRGIAEAPEPTYLLYAKDDPSALHRLTAVKPIPLPADTPESLKRLKVNILHGGIVRGLMGVHDDEISYSQDYLELAARVREGATDFAFFVPPTTVEEVKEVADKGLVMPPKSTFFYPKLLTGLVFFRYE